MSLNTAELNYIIWRYLQEAGFETAALALMDDTNVVDFDARFKEHVPIGALVDLVQKGILYTEADRLVGPNGEVYPADEYTERFTMLHALDKEAAQNGKLDVYGRFAAIAAGTEFSDLTDLPEKPDPAMIAALNISTDGSSSKPAESAQEEDKSDKAEPATNGARERSPDFIKVLKTDLKITPTTASKFNPSQSQIFAVGLTESRAKIYVMGRGEEAQQFSMSHPQVFSSEGTTDITTLAWDPKGTLLVTAVESGELRLWNSEGRLRNVMTMHTAPVIAIKWNVAGDQFLSMDCENVTILWDASTGTVVQHYDSLRSSEAGPDGELHPLGTDLDWIDESKFVTAGLNGTALVFNTRERQPQGTLFGHTKPLCVVKFNQEHKLLLTASDDYSIRVWNGASFNSAVIFTGHSQPLISADWVSRDVVVSAALDSTVRLWSIAAAREICLAVVDSEPILVSSLAPSKKMFAVGTTEGIVTVYNIVLGAEAELKAYGVYQPDITGKEGNVITDISWSCDSQKLIVGYSSSESVILSGF